MNTSRAALAACVSLAAGFPLAPAFAQQVVRIDGSSTVFPITEAIAEEFQKARGQAFKVAVAISGTGGGFRKFCRGEIDISNASRPILKAEMAECASGGIDYLELPVAFDALTVVINPRNAFVKQLTLAQMKKVWEPAAQGKVLRWNQVDPGWPDQPMKLFGPGPESGSFDYFTEAVVGRPKSSRTDFTASEDDDVLVQGVARDVNALGYFGLAYYTENRNRLKAVAIVNGKGQAVSPSPEAVTTGVYSPLSRPIFIYVSAKSFARPAVRQFVEYYMKNGARLSREAKYVALPDSAYALGWERAKAGRKGTVFGGVAEIGVTIDDLLKREARQ